jgi:hypothetical protein
MRKISSSLLGMIVLAAAAFSGTEPTIELQQNPPSKGENSQDLLYTESTYTFRSDFKESRMGDGDSWYNDFMYDHRFPITGKWYLRLGVEYERFDFNFSGTNNGLPDHLQAAYAHVAYEYVVHDSAGAGIELDPGVFFQEHVRGNSFDIPWKVFVTFPIKKDKIFGVIGLGGALNQDPIVAPGGGLIWLFTDKLRLQGVFPKPALVYNPNDDWEFRLLGDLNFDEFRTDDVITPLAKLREHNAIVQYSEERVGLQVKYSGLKPFNIIAGAGCTFRRNFDFFRLPVEEKTDPAPYLRVALEGRF